VVRGSSEPALEVAAKHVDTYLTWGESLADTAEKIAAVRHRAAAYGRQLRFGIRLNLVVRETEEQAWAAADAMVAHMLPERVAAMQRALSSGDSVGQHRMLGYHGGVIPQRARDLEIGPNLWAGFGLVRPGPGLALVGSPSRWPSGCSNTGTWYRELHPFRPSPGRGGLHGGRPPAAPAALDPVGPDARPRGRTRPSAPSTPSWSGPARPEQLAGRSAPAEGDADQQRAVVAALAVADGIGGLGQRVEYRTWSMRR